MNEAQTRLERIDPQLRAAGWGLVDGSRIRVEHSITLGRLEGNGRRGKPLAADYVLEYRNTKLAVIEAKPWSAPLTEGVGQAKDYATKLRVRFTYSTNGQGFYAVDMHQGVEGPIDKFPSPEDLWTATFSVPNAWRDRFAAIPFEDKGGSFQGRYYQELAIGRALDAVIDGRDRILLTLATGTGKTFIAFQLAWKLFHSRWNLGDWKRDGEPTRRPRILFLADRNILADQAFSAFSAFEDRSPGTCVRIAPDEIQKRGKVPKNGSIFFTIFQTFMTGRNEKGEPAPYFGDYPADFFDLIIIDECHRGGARDESTWRGILEYFSPAVQLGLTATPKRKDNADTYAYFGEPAFVYSLKEGINDGFLTPFRVVQVQTTLDEYVYTPGDLIVKGDVQEGRLYVEKDFNKVIEIPERERKRVEIFMTQMNQRHKTLVFCANQAHALVVRDFVNQLKTSPNPDYCHRVTADEGGRGEQWLKAFQDNEKTIPTVLTTSQKLTTGVDARNVRNIVLMRSIESMIEFKQIIGRGTRLYEGKDYFTIYDFVKAHRLFLDPEWDGDPIEPDPCKKCGSSPCVCPPIVRKPCAVCGQDTCVCAKPACEKCGQIPCACERRAKIKLADGKSRLIQHMTATTFWHPDGTPMSAEQFMESLFGRLPDFFKDEAELRALWSDPDTRRRLLDGLADKGFGKEQLAEMQRIVNAEKSDLFDVLAHVAFAMAPLTREERAQRAMALVSAHFKGNQKVFLDFVLSHYVAQGIDELETTRLTPLLKLKYHDSISDAVNDLGGNVDEIRNAFVGFQRFLYDEVA